MENEPIAKKRGPGSCRDIAAFAAIAVVYIAGAWFISRAVGPFRGDPDYQYLFSGLSILTFKAPYYHDHPGTPVQEIIALVSGMTWLLTFPQHGFANVRDQVLAHAQFYLACSYGVFVAGIAAGMVFFSWCVRKSGGAMLPAVIGLLSIFCSVAVYPSFHKVSPEPALLAATLILAGLIARTVYAPDLFAETRSLGTAIGILLGFCLTAKVTSAPVLLTFFFLRSKEARKAAVLAFAASAIVFLLPAAPHARSMLRSYFRILTHRGDYGSRAAGPPSPSDLWANLVLQWKIVPEIFVALALYLMILIGSRATKLRLPDNYERALLVCTAVISFAIILTLKQFRAYYLIPEMAFICLANSIVAALVLRTFRFPLLLGIAAVTLGIWAFRTQSQSAIAAAADWKSETLTMTRAANSGCLVVPYYFADMTVWDLYFGNESEGHIYNTQLAHAYPGFLTYNIFGKDFERFDSQLSSQAAARRLAAEKCIYLMGRSWDPEFGIASAFLTPITPANSTLSLYALRPGWNGH